MRTTQNDRLGVGGGALRGRQYGGRDGVGVTAIDGVGEAVAGDRRDVGVRSELLDERGLVRRRGGGGRGPHRDGATVPRGRLDRGHRAHHRHRRTEGRARLGERDDTGRVARQHHDGGAPVHGPPSGVDDASDGPLHGLRAPRSAVGVQVELQVEIGSRTTQPSGGRQGAEAGVDQRDGHGGSVYRRAGRPPRTPTSTGNAERRPPRRVSAAGEVRRVSYLMIFVTRPAPTVRPPSRMANRRPSSMATGWISTTDISVLSPGMTISVPSGRVTTPVTSVVRK